MPALSSTPGVSRSWRNSTLMWMVCVYSRSYRLLSTCTTCSQADEQCNLCYNFCFKALRNFCCSSYNIHQLCTKYHLQLGQWTVWPVVTLASKSSVIFVALAATFISFLLEVESVFRCTITSSPTLGRPETPTTLPSSFWRDGRSWDHPHSIRLEHRATVHSLHVGILQVWASMYLGPYLPLMTSTIATRRLCCRNQYCLVPRRLAP